MKIAVVDIETTGFHTQWASIVEIGIALVDTEKSTIKLIYDEIVNDKFRPNSDWNKKAWIFNNTDLTIDEVAKAITLKEQFDSIQTIFDKYPVTAFNSSFDFGFLKYRGFKLNEIKCIQKTSKQYLNTKF